MRRSQECLEYFFGDTDDSDEDYLFLDERMENDPELLQKVHEEMDKNPPPQNHPHTFNFGGYNIKDQNVENKDNCIDTSESAATN